MSERCHEVDYEIIGHSMQLVEVGSILTKPWSPKGAMNYLEQDISFERPKWAMVLNLVRLLASW